jgi:tellurite resistance protein TerC
MPQLIDQPYVLGVFALVVCFILLLDLGVFNKESHVISNKEALSWSILWIGLSMLFSVFIYQTSGVEKFYQYQSAYWIEKMLSVDNLFVFILVFGYFNVPKKNHHKVLFWGILGAIVFRAFFIFTGVGLIKKTYLPEFEIFNRTVEVNALLTFFGLFLIYAGIKSWFQDDGTNESKDFSNSPGARIIKKLFTVSKHYDNGNFFTIENGKRVATPMLMVIGVIEFTDILFAVDSIPAIFAIAPDDPFILYTSNIFAILGLRALYFLLANFIYLFDKLKYGLAIILSFIGVKMIIAPFYHVESFHSLLVILSLLVISVIASLLFPGDKNKSYENL